MLSFLLLLLFCLFTEATKSIEPECKTIIHIKKKENKKKNKKLLDYLKRSYFMR